MSRINGEKENGEDAKVSATAEGETVSAPNNSSCAGDTEADADVCLQSQLACESDDVSVHMRVIRADRQGSILCAIDKMVSSHLRIGGSNDRNVDTGEVSDREACDSYVGHALPN